MKGNRNALDRIALQIQWDRLLSVVEEQAQALVRTAFSPAARESGDISAGCFDLRGRMLAQAVTGTPGHINTMAAAVTHFLDRFPTQTMRPGDAYVTNDPWMGSGHLNDFTMVSPTFRAGHPVALFACTTHVVDVGGRGFGADGRQVYEEGVNIPPTAIRREGELNETLMSILRANVRNPVEVEGDLHSLVGCNEVGSARLNAMMDEFDLPKLDDLGRHILDASREGMLAEIRKLPPGCYRNEMQVDGYDAPIRLCVSVTVGTDGLDIDFAGTSGMSSYGINVPFTYTQAYASFGARCAVGPNVPNNAGSLGTIRVTAPEGSILNPPPPAAVAARHATGHFLPDAVLGALASVIPERCPAEGASTLWNPVLLGGHGLVDGDYGDAEPFAINIFHAGGGGARPGKDGLDATAFPSGVRNTPVEVNEAIAPLIFWRKEYRPDSGGAGRFRGGLGQIMEIGHATGAPFAVSPMFDRIDHPARGRDGGGDGAAGRLYLRSGATLRGKGRQTVPAGDRLVMEMPGGGGMGDPAARDSEALARDRLNDLTTTGDG